MSAERQRDVQVDVDTADNRARVVVTERWETEVAELFDENGELRLWEDDAGWSGHLLDDGTYYFVNTCHDSDDWASKQIVTEETVAVGVETHIRRPEAGGEGVFRRRCSPP